MLIKQATEFKLRGLGPPSRTVGQTLFGSFWNFNLPGC